MDRTPWLWASMGVYDQHERRPKPQASSLDGVELRNSSGYRESTRTKYVDRVATTQSITEQLSAISGRPRLREHTKGYFPDMVMEGRWSYCPVSYFMKRLNTYCQAAKSNPRQVHCIERMVTAHDHNVTESPTISYFSDIQHSCASARHSANFEGTSHAYLCRSDVAGVRSCRAQRREHLHRRSRALHVGQRTFIIRSFEMRSTGDVDAHFMAIAVGEAASLSDITTVQKAPMLTCWQSWVLTPLFMKSPTLGLQ
ncbi:hypothetical protein BC629DRAFT_1434309 [Irpex lacteus]|nr:hypothetical protein BC629DRAFT_1434309 [Irpex lacteus]